MLACLYEIKNKVPFYFGDFSIHPDLANDGAVGKNPQRSRDSVVVSSSVEVDVLERLRSNASSLGVVSGLEGLEVDVFLAVGIEFDGHISREIEVGI